MADVLVLCYHAVSESWPEDTAVRPAELSEHVSGLKARGYRFVTFSEALSAPPGGRVVSLTFDDAARSVFELARPALDAHGLAATVFVPTRYATNGELMSWSGQEEYVGTAHEAELRCMSWDQLGELASAGWEIGSHSRTHPHLSQLSDDVLAEELGGSREDVEQRLGLECRSLAYPYGDFDGRVVEAAGRAGYRFAATTVPSASGPPPLLEWPRVGAYRGDSARRLRARVWRRQTLARTRGGRLVSHAAGRALRALSMSK